MIHLLLELPGGLRREVPLTGRATLGRSKTCTVPLPYVGVSRIHAEVVGEDGGWVVLDKGSHNGTRVNGEKVDRALLREGDLVELGPVRVRIGSSRPQSAEATILGTAPALDLARLPPAATLDPERLVRDYELVRAAQETSRAIGDARTAPDVLTAVLAFCRERLAADRATVLLREADGLVVRGSTGADGTTVSRTVLRALLDRGEALLVLDAAAELPGAQSVAAMGTASLLAAPLVREGEVLGAIVIDNRERRAAFSRADLDVLTGIAAQVALSLERAELLLRVAAEGETRWRLSRFLPPELVEQVVRGDLRLEPGGRESRVAVLYCDIRGFTPLTRQLGPAATVALLNDYFAATVPVVHAGGGMVDKFVGDELMAVFGVPEPRADDVTRAVECAVALQHAIRGLAAQRSARGDPSFACGVGVNAGPAMIGLVGSAGRLQYTVIGDAVNLGARLCSAAGAGEVVVPAELVAGWTGPAFAEAEAVELKGVAGPLPVRRWRVASVPRP